MYKRQNVILINYSWLLSGNAEHRNYSHLEAYVHLLYPISTRSAELQRLAMQANGSTVGEQKQITAGLEN